jgi:hypothetical protein
MVSAFRHLFEIPNSPLFGKGVDMDTRKLGIGIVMAVVVFAFLYFGGGAVLDNMMCTYQPDCPIPIDIARFLRNNKPILSLALAVLAAGLFLAISQDKSMTGQ